MENAARRRRPADQPVEILDPEQQPREAFDHQTVETTAPEGGEDPEEVDEDVHGTRRRPTVEATLNLVKGLTEESDTGIGETIEIVRIDDVRKEKRNADVEESPWFEHPIRFIDDPLRL